MSEEERWVLRKDGRGGIFCQTCGTVIYAEETTLNREGSLAQYIRVRDGAKCPFCGGCPLLWILDSKQPMHADELEKLEFVYGEEQERTIVRIVI